MSQGLPLRAVPVPQQAANHGGEVRKVVGIGAGGHARTVLDILQLTGEYEVVGLLDPDSQLHGSTVMGVPVLGGDDLSSALRQSGLELAFAGMGGAGDNRPRRRIFELIQEHGFRPINVIHPESVIATSATMGRGVTVAALAVVGAEARLGDNVIVNTGALVEHNCHVENHVHIATGAQLAGGVKLGEGAHVGIGAVVRQNVRIGRWAIVGAGAAVIRDVADGEKVAGVPAAALAAEHA